MRFCFLLAFPLLLAACQTEPADDVDPVDTTADDGDAMTDTAGTAGGPAARADIEPLGDSEVRGTVTFTPQNGGVLVTVGLSGLTPGSHGFHIHQNGSCAPEDLPEDPDTDPNPGGGAGPHFGPGGTPHGAPLNAATQRHAGDFGNVFAHAGGAVDTSFTDAVITLTGPNSIIGKAVLVHANPDDLTSQPSGNAGARIGCGIVMSGDSGGAAPMPADTANQM
ncbi:MAG TPA: superoxide dismutase family protein [Rubricoccaceae bacterium]|nr:superoxide dismutase family protein [Rubricoccaceae bacterium]